MPGAVAGCSMCGQCRDVISRDSLRVECSLQFSLAVGSQLVQLWSSCETFIQTVRT
jgi:hypothetical protein